VKEFYQIVEEIESYSYELEIQQRPDEIAEFLYVCQERGVQTVLELGTGTGGLASYMEQALGWSVTSVDISEPEYQVSEFIQASTVDAYPGLYGREFDMVFIDAGHSLNEALRDYYLYQHHAQLIAMHDIGAYRKTDATWAADVRTAWDTVAPENATEIIAADDPLGIGYFEQPARSWVNLSIVTGTVNRFAMLRKMIESARENIPVGITYEFVIVAQGCNDGSVEWLREQDDVILLEYPAMIGGIRAFNIGCYHARGDYVLVANDDIKFHSGSIVRALSHLAGTPTCGGVAFSPHPPGRVKVMKANLGGNEERVYYAEVGLFPKWLGDWADWWGAFSGMAKRASGLYGGDNHLSSVIWEAGYSIDAPRGVSIDDYKPRDEVKQHHNRESIQADAAQYYRKFPDGPALGNDPKFGQRPRTLRILNLPIIANERSRASKHAEREALQKIGLVYEFDFMNNPADPAQAAATWKPDLIFTQFHSPRKMSAKTLRRMRAAAPKAVVINRNFDAQDGKHHGAAIREILEHVDLQLHKNAAQQARYDADGLLARYWVEGYEEPVLGYEPEAPAHDVVVQMNIYPHREKLRAAIEALAESGVNVGMYGNGWTAPTGNTHYDFTAGDYLYKKARLAVSDTYPGAQAYMSRRVAQIMAAGGALCLLQFSPGLDDAIGFEEGEHYIAWHDTNDLREQIAYWLDGRRESKRKRIVEQAQQFAVDHLSCLATMRQLWFDILPEVWPDA